MTPQDISASRPEDQRKVLECYDKTGRPIMVGDVLKVFHFVGARRKHYFMFKQVIGIHHWKDGTRVLEVSHLNMKEWRDRDGGYSLACDGTTYPDTEIVQGLDWHHDRPLRRHHPIERP